MTIANSTIDIYTAGSIYVLANLYGIVKYNLQSHCCDRCKKIHRMPETSDTLLFRNFYSNFYLNHSLRDDIDKGFIDDMYSISISN